MSEAKDLRKDFEADLGEEVFSKPVRAGKRTYFFDVKTTKSGDDFFITITESRKKTSKDGAVFFDKHKIYLYKEDFGKFSEGFNCVVDFIKSRKPEFFEEHVETVQPVASIDEEFDRL